MAFVALDVVVVLVEASSPAVPVVAGDDVEASFDAANGAVDGTAVVAEPSSVVVVDIAVVAGDGDHFHRP